MAEPFKSVFNPVMIAAMAGHLAARAPGFDREVMAMACRVALRGLGETGQRVGTGVSPR